MPRPLKVATPEVIVAVALKSEPELEANWAVMVPLALVTTLPEESSTFTTGWVAKAAPLLAVELGAVVTTIFDAAPALSVMLDEGRDAGVLQPVLAVKVRV